MLLLLGMFIHQPSPLVYISSIAVISKMTFKRKMLVCSPKAVSAHGSEKNEAANSSGGGDGLSPEMLAEMCVLPTPQDGAVCGLDSSQNSVVHQTPSSLPGTSG